MNLEYLHRDDLPLGPEVWERIDQTVIGVAREQLAARRLMSVEGPFGLSLKHLPGADRDVEGKQTTLSASPARPLALIRRTFRLSTRDLSSFQASGLPLDLGPLVEAALAVAAQEDAVLFHGSAALGLDGLLTAPLTQSVGLSSWDAVGAAAGNIIDAVTLLDRAGFRGPYTLALAPALYIRLLRLYGQTGTTELEHVQTIVGGSVIKAAAIEGGVLLAAGGPYASIVLGQDLMAGLVGPHDGGYEFILSESVALRLAVPSAVCIIK